MIFEGRSTQLPSADLVKVRDQLEEATALARSNRGTGTPVASAAPVGATATPAPAVIETTTVTGSAPVVPDEDAPARTESLPPTP
jgi:hypothetical protein